MNEVSSEDNSPMSRSLLLNIIPEVLILAVAIVFFVVALDFEYVQRAGRLGPAFWPQVICIGIFVCALATMVTKIRAHGLPAAPIKIEGMTEDEEKHPLQWHLLVMAIVLAVAYPMGTIILGYPIATALFLILFMYLGNRRKWYIFPIGILGSLLFTYVFGKVVYISVPTGVGVFDQLSVVVYQFFGIY